MIVGATWAGLAALALLFGPAAAFTAAAIPLALTARAAWAAKWSSDWHSPEHETRRQVTALALLAAGALSAGTYAAMRDRLPPWAIWLEAGMLLHYWLLTLTGRA